jgi:hypothetical protein
MSDEDEREWEYGIRYYEPSFEQYVVMPDASAIAWGLHAPGTVRVRRTKPTPAGPWEVVPDDLES